MVCLQIHQYAGDIMNEKFEQCSMQLQRRFFTVNERCLLNTFEPITDYNLFTLEHVKHIYFHILCLPLCNVQSGKLKPVTIATEHNWQTWRSAGLNNDTLIQAGIQYL